MEDTGGEVRQDEDSEKIQQEELEEIAGWLTGL